MLSRRAGAICSQSVNATRPTLSSVVSDDNDGRQSYLQNPKVIKFPVGYHQVVKTDWLD